MSHIEQLIEQRVAERQLEWFPGREQSRQVWVRALGRRPKSSLFGVYLGDPGGPPQILAKTRLAGATASPQGRPRPSGRPRLRAEPATPQELAALEYEGLQSIVALFGTSHPTFGVVRPLDHLEAESTILMEYVDAVTLRHRLIGESRLLPHHFATRRRMASSNVWRDAGGWLRAFQQATPTRPRPARQSTRQDIVDRLLAYGDFLTGRLGGRAVGDVSARAAELAAAVLPERLPLAVSHGDYAPRNMFVDDHDRITVFDPLPRWVVPRYEDLCRLLVGIRMLGLQLHSHGAAFHREALERHERDAIDGYLAGDEPLLPQIQCYELLILLDKWSALVESSTAGRGWRRRLNETSLALSSRYVRDQAERILELSRVAAG